MLSHGCREALGIAVWLAIRLYSKTGLAGLASGHRDNARQRSTRFRRDAPELSGNPGWFSVVSFNQNSKGPQDLGQGFRLQRIGGQQESRKGNRNSRHQATRLVTSNSGTIGSAGGHDSQGAMSDFGKVPRSIRARSSTTTGSIGNGSIVIFRVGLVLVFVFVAVLVVAAATVAAVAAAVMVKMLAITIVSTCTCSTSTAKACTATASQNHGTQHVMPEKARQGNSSNGTPKKEDHFKQEHRCLAWP